MAAAAALLDQVDGRVAVRGLCLDLGAGVGDGALPAAGLQQVGAEYLHSVVPPPLGAPVGEPHLENNSVQRLEIKYFAIFKIQIECVYVKL